MGKHPAQRTAGFIGSMLLLVLLLVACSQTTSPADTSDATTEDTAETADEPGAAVSDDQIRTPEGNIEDFWNGFDWADLTTAEQEAWGVLGWDETSWDEETNIPASESATWDELSAEEQAAASSLGYNQQNWDPTAPEE